MAGLLINIWFVPVDGVGALCSAASTEIWEGDSGSLWVPHHSPAGVPRSPEKGRTVKSICCLCCFDKYMLVMSHILSELVALNNW